MSTSSLVPVPALSGGDLTRGGGHHRLDEGGVPIDDPGPPEPLVDIGAATLTEPAPHPLVGAQEVQDRLELAESGEAQSTSRPVAVLDGGAAGGIDHHRGPGAPCLGDDQ